MYKADEKTFLMIFFNNYKALPIPYLMDSVVCVHEVWDDLQEKTFDTYLMSPETYSKYLKFIDIINTTKPLLKELC